MQRVLQALQGLQEPLEQTAQCQDLQVRLVLQAQLDLLALQALTLQLLVQLVLQVQPDPQDQQVLIAQFLDQQELLDQQVQLVLLVQQD